VYYEDSIELDININIINCKLGLINS